MQEHEFLHILLLGHSQLAHCSDLVPGDFPHMHLHTLRLRFGWQWLSWDFPHAGRALNAHSPDLYIVGAVRSWFLRSSLRWYRAGFVAIANFF